MEKDAVSVPVEHFSPEDRVAVEVIDRFPQAVLRYLDHWVCDLWAGHPAWEGGSSVAEQHIHKHLQGDLPFLQQIFNAFLVVQLGGVLDHDPRDQKLQQYLGDEAFFEILFYEGHTIGGYQNAMG